jgi:hypothetical protein
MAEAFAANFAERDFHAALVADHAAVLHPLVLAAQAFPVGDGAKNLGAEQAVTLGFEGAVVDGLRLGDFAVGPGTDFFRTRQADANGIEIRDQAGAIIRAAAIQGCFLPPQLSPGPRADAASARLRTQKPKLTDSRNVAWQGHPPRRAPLRPAFHSVGCFLRRLLAFHQLNV